MTIEVNFNEKTGLSFIVLRTAGYPPTTWAYQGPDEEKTDAYTFDVNKVHAKNADRILSEVNAPKVYKTFKTTTAYDRTVELKFAAAELKQQNKIEKKLGKVYGSFWSGVDIDGLHEDRMTHHWENTNRESPEFFKGSAFGWAKDRDRTSHSVVARLLAVGLPDRLKGKVSIGVKSRWTAHDVQVYAETIWRKIRTP